MPKAAAQEQQRGETWKGKDVEGGGGRWKVEGGTPWQFTSIQRHKSNTIFELNLGTKRRLQLRLRPINGGPAPPALPALPLPTVGQFRQFVSHSPIHPFIHSLIHSGSQSVIHLVAQSVSQTVIRLRTHAHNGTVIELIWKAQAHSTGKDR